MAAPILYFDPTSEPCRAAYWLAVDGGFPVRVRYTWLSRGEHKGAELTAVNPCQQVPALWHDGFALAEATAIMHYLADTAGRLDAWFGATPRERASVHRLLSWYHTNLRQKVTYDYFAAVLFGPAAAGACPPEDAAARRDAALRVLGRIEGFLDASPYLAGDRPSAADVLFAAELGALAIDPDRETLFADLPVTRHWLEAMRSRPGYEVSHRGWDRVVPLLRERAARPGEPCDPAWIADRCEQALG